MSGHGLGLRLHHVGMVVADIREAAGIYARRFGYDMRSPVIHDAVQTAYVQFLALPGETHYLELVSPDGPGSKLAGALARGGGLNHLCYQTPDIDAACGSLRAEGLLILQRPVPAAAFPRGRIAWLMGQDRTPIELVEGDLEAEWPGPAEAGPSRADG